MDHHPLTFSHGLRQLLEGLPARVPLSFEVLDRSFNVVFPDSSHHPFPLLEVTQELREQLHSPNAGRPRTLLQRGQRIDLYPVIAGNDRSWTLLLALGAEAAHNAVLSAWGPILRSALEADLAAAEELQRQASAAQHRAAALRFIRHLVTTSSETERLRAVLQAAAVWFDLDTRIYKREAGGDYVLHMCLPSTVVLPDHRISGAMVSGTTEARRFSSAADLEALDLPGESAVFIPMGAPDRDLLLVLVGGVPAEMELTFGAIAAVAGGRAAQLESRPVRAAAGLEIAAPVSPPEEAPRLPDPRQQSADAFLKRIEEEIARARRYNLDLALIIVKSDSLQQPDRFDQVIPKVRAELRDSDLLAPIGPDEVAALLIQTGGAGGEAVVRRLHRRFSEDESLSGGAFVGHAAFSNDCATAAALLSRARGPAGLPRFSQARPNRTSNSEPEFFTEQE